MTITQGYELATDPFFRELSNFITPPRAGKVTAIEGSGQVRVDTDDPDGGDVLAWPLNDFTYSVNDVVYVQFGVNNPDSAIVLGSKGATPTLASYIRRNGADILTANWDIGEDRRILAEALRARDNEGLRFEDDSGAPGIIIRDGGLVEVGPGVTGAGSGTLYVAPASGADASVYIDSSGAGTARYAALFLNADGGYMQYVSWGTTGAGTRFGQALADSGDFITVNLTKLLIGTLGSAPIYFGTNGTLAGRITEAQDWGIGTLAPQGKLHAWDGTGGFLFVTKTGVVGTAITIIPNATGDVTKTCYCVGVITNSTPTNFVIDHKIDNGGSQNYNDGGGNTLQLAVAANGTLTVQRTLGAATWALTMLVVWQ